MSVRPSFAIACSNTCVHDKDAVVHVIVRWIAETLKHPACTLGWVARLCRSWLSRISRGRNPSGQCSCLKKKKPLLIHPPNHSGLEQPAPGRGYNSHLRFLPVPTVQRPLIPHSHPLQFVFALMRAFHSDTDFKLMKLTLQKKRRSTPHASLWLTKLGRGYIGIAMTVCPLFIFLFFYFWPWAIFSEPLNHFFSYLDCGCFESCSCREDVCAALFSRSVLGDAFFFQSGSGRRLWLFCSRLSDWERVQTELRALFVCSSSLCS